MNVNPPADHRRLILTKSKRKRTEGSRSLVVEGVHRMDSALDAVEGLPQPRGQDSGHLCHLSLMSTHPPVFLVTFIFPLTEVRQFPPFLLSWREESRSTGYLVDGDPEGRETESTRKREGVAAARLSLA